jgi:hypothetical protein
MIGTSGIFPPGPHRLRYYRQVLPRQDEIDAIEVELNPRCQVGDKSQTPCQPRRIRLMAIAARRSAIIFDTPRSPCLPIQRVN